MEAYRFRKPWLLATGKDNIDKILWEGRGVLRAAATLGADVLHSPYLAAPLSLAPRVPVVVTAHDMIPWIVPGYSRSAAVKLYLALAAQAAKRAGLILADSEASRQDVIKVLNVPEWRVRTVYLGMEEHPTYGPEQLDGVRARHGLPRDFAFYLGGFDRRKNVPLLLSAWRGFIEGSGVEWCADDKPLLAIGGSVPKPGGVFPDVRGQAERMGLLGGQNATVRFLGRVSEEDKPLLMAASRVFVYPSAYEGFGLDPLEAMSVGGAVISSSGGSLSEVVGDGGLQVPPGDESALREAIQRIWSDRLLRESLAEKGRLQAQKFTWGRTADQTLQAYRDVRRQGRGRSARGNGNMR
jgi:glycosyltransferase involved in cell wall biosynthesis